MPEHSGSALTIQRVQPYERRGIAVASSAIGADGYIDDRFSAYIDDQVPPLSWSAVIEARSYVLIVEDPDAPMDSCTVATAHEAGWTWDIGLNGARGIGCVYSSDHMSDERAAQVLRGYVGPAHADVVMRRIPFAPGWRERQWV